MSTFTLKIKDYNEDGQIVTIGEKEFYNVDDNKRASKWVRTNTKGHIIEVPFLKSSLNITEHGSSNYDTTAIGSFYSAGNSLQFSTQQVALFSSNCSMTGSCIINNENFNRVVALFAARKLIDQNWVNDNDEYMVPNVNHPDYEQWNNDCVVFSLFHSASNQSSLRNIEYKGKTWNIQNEWFWVDFQTIKELANQYNFNECFNDITNDTKNTYVYNLLQSIKLSPDAQELITLAKELVIKSFQYRKISHESDPKYHLQAWNAGWYQIKNGIMKEYLKDDHKLFTDKYKQFANRLKEGVYKFGFLK